MIDFKGKRMLYPLFFIVLTGIIIFNVIQIIHNSRDFNVEAQKVHGGWGFKIVHKKKVFINQPFIPLLQGKQAFPSRRTAIKTGRLLLKRINARQLPPLTKKDLYGFGIDTLKAPNPEPGKPYQR